MLPRDLLRAWPFDRDQTLVLRQRVAAILQRQIDATAGEG